MAAGGRVPGLRVTFDAPPNGRVEAEVIYVGDGTLFLVTDKPARAGRRVALLLSFAETRERSAVGLVLQSSSTGRDAAPAGMSVKLVDGTETVMGLIAELAGHDENAGAGIGGSRAPVRERTMLGVAPAADGLGEARVVVAPVGRDRTIVGVAPPPRRPLPKDISVGELPAPEGWDDVEPPRALPSRPKRSGRGWRWLVLLVLLAGAGGAAAWRRHELAPALRPVMQRLYPVIERVRTFVRINVQRLRSEGAPALCSPACASVAMRPAPEGEQVRRL